MFLQTTEKRLALLPLRDGVFLTIRRLSDEGAEPARFCLTDDSNTPFIDPYTKKNTWSRVALNNMLGRNNWKVGQMVKFDVNGYNLHEPAQP